MAEKKKGKKRKEEYAGPGEEAVPKPSKNEYSVAKWLRKNVPIKKTKFLNHNVEYFTGSKAVEGLLESKWSKDEKSLFKTREEIVDFLHLMLEHKFFHRARKVPVSEQELKTKKKEKKSSSIESSDEKKEKSEKAPDVESEAKLEAAGDKDKDKEKDKKKRKVRLEMHNDQRFVDSLDAYVWIYDPIPFYYWIIGTFFVLGAIGICLFPLWPPSVRLGVYYLSVAAAGFLVFIVFLVVLRLIIFCMVWILTVGKHHIWILPNLTEDVGFFESFWPLYKYKYKGADSTNNKKEKKKKKDKHSDEEGENEDRKDEQEKEPQESSSVRHRGAQSSNNDNGKQSESPMSSTDGGGSRVETVVNGGSESESESSQRSSTGKDFEMVDQDDLEEES